MLLIKTSSMYHHRNFLLAHPAFHKSSYITPLHHPFKSLVVIFKMFHTVPHMLTYTSGRFKNLVQIMLSNPLMNLYKKLATTHTFLTYLNKNKHRKRERENKGEKKRAVEDREIGREETERKRISAIESIPQCLQQPRLEQVEIRNQKVNQTILHGCHTSTTNYKAASPCCINQKKPGTEKRTMIQTQVLGCGTQTSQAVA